jgi:hypothetical protein
MDETKRDSDFGRGLQHADLHDLGQQVSKAIKNNDWEGALAHIGKMSAGITKRLNDQRKADRQNTVYTVSGAIREFGKVEEL